jgi:hypothetical protein
MDNNSDDKIWEELEACIFQMVDEYNMELDMIP